LPKINHSHTKGCEAYQNVSGMFASANRAICYKSSPRSWSGLRAFHYYRSCERHNHI